MSSETVSLAKASVLTHTVPGTQSAPLARQKEVALPDMPPPPRPKLPEPDVEQQQAVAAQIENFVEGASRDLQFAIDPASRRTVVTVRDATGAVVREIPPATQIRMAALLEGGLGTLFDGKA